jgi:hypothetical protein
VNWRVEPTIIDEYVPAPRPAWHVVNELGEVADESQTEIYETAVEMAATLNSEDQRTKATPILIAICLIGIAIWVAVISVVFQEVL